MAKKKQKKVKLYTVCEFTTGKTFISKIKEKEIDELMKMYKEADMAKSIKVYRPTENGNYVCIINETKKNKCGFEIKA